MNVIEILSMGVSGFAFLMLYIGFQLTSSVQKKILDVNVQQTDAEKLEIWGKLAERQLTNTRYFMAFSFVFLSIGLVVLQLQFRPEASIRFSIAPSETEYLPSIFAQNEQVVLDVHGKGAIKVKDENMIIVDNKAIFNALKEEQKKAETLMASEKAFAEKLAALNKDSGFGSIFRGN